MTIRSRLDAFEKQMKIATVALSKQGRLPRKVIYLNDPEEDLDEYRLDPGLMTIEIGEVEFEALRGTGDGGRRTAGRIAPRDTDAPPSLS
jgi:hypothetical protein